MKNRLFVIKASYFLGIALVIGLSFASLSPENSAHSYYLNLSSSVPPGIYAASSPQLIAVGDMVIFSPPRGAHTFIYGRKWLPKGWPLLKFVGAVEGDTYSVKNNEFRINGKYVGPVFEKDTEDLPLPRHEGSWTVGKDEFLPVSAHIKYSFDGRYFGTVPIASIQKKVVPKITF